jgi:hypothetical protein
VAVFHGRRDNSAPFADAEQRVAALRQAGARATFVVKDEAATGLRPQRRCKECFDGVHSTPPSTADGDAATAPRTHLCHECPPAHSKGQAGHKAGPSTVFLYLKEISA